MKSKRVFLIVEPTKGAITRLVTVIKKPSKKYSGTLVISFPDFETLGKIITGSRIEILKTIRVEKPRSIQKLAKILKRNFKNVYQDVQLLAEYGLIDLKGAGPRQTPKPEAKFSELVLAA